MREFLRPSEDGEYEEYYVPVMAACAGIGEAVFNDWQEWVLRGHHGEKEENIQPFKWRGLGKYGGHTKLYSLAKKQNASWTSFLPDNLRFGAVGTAVGYTEFDPTFDLDEYFSNTETKPTMTAEVIELEPLPDTQGCQAWAFKKSSDDAVKERANDVRSQRDPQRST